MVALVLAFFLGFEIDSGLTQRDVVLFGVVVAAQAVALSVELVQNNLSSRRLAVRHIRNARPRVTLVLLLAEVVAAAVRVLAVRDHRFLAHTVNVAAVDAVVCGHYHVWVVERRARLTILSLVG